MKQEEIIEKILKKRFDIKGNVDSQSFLVERGLMNKAIEEAKKEKDKEFSRILVKITSKFGARETLLALGEFKDIEILTEEELKNSIQRKEVKQKMNKTKEEQLKEAYADYWKADADWRKADADFEKADADWKKSIVDREKANADRAKAYARIKELDKENLK